MVWHPWAASVVQPIPDEILVKGDAEPALKVYRQRGVAHWEIGDDDVVAAGDRLQLRYRAAGAAYGVIVSLDGRGHVTQHFPSARGASTALKSGGEVALDHSYELDDAPMFERFYFVTSQQPLDPDAVAAAVAKLADHDGELELPAGEKVTIFTARKQP
jgi:hypothetical protein